MLLDLDNFKLVNDTIGHPAGDEALVALSQALEEELRPGDFLARVGGDEFAALIHDVTTQEANTAAERILERVRGIRLHDMDFTVSAGICAITGDPDPTGLLTSADGALYAAKQNGRNRTFSVGAGDVAKLDLTRASRWVPRIKAAIAENRLVVELQPIVKLSDGTVDWFEALARIREPEQLLRAAAFIPLAERFGLMPQIDRAVLKAVLVSLQADPELRVMMNLSASSFDDESLFDLIESEITAAALAPGRLGFEVTEASAIRDLTGTARRMQTLKQLGCLLALDDFGVGFSSFAELRQLPVDFVKLSGSFIEDLPTDPASRAIVEGIVGVAHALGKEVIAELVESEVVLAALRALGVEYGQGFYWDRPDGERAPVDELAAAV